MQSSCSFCGSRNTRYTSFTSYVKSISFDIPSDWVNPYEQRILSDHLMINVTNMNDIIDKVLNEKDIKYNGKSLTATNSCCTKCGNELWKKVLYSYRESLTDDKLPKYARGRTKCWYGYECRTMNKKTDHAENLCHIGPNTRTNATGTIVINSGTLSNSTSASPLSSNTFNSTSDSSQPIKPQNSNSDNFRADYKEKEQIFRGLKNTNRIQYFEMKYGNKDFYLHDLSSSASGQNISSGPSASIEFAPEQELAIQKALRGESFFFTGSAGKLQITRLIVRKN
jgi:hypothetical protein